MTKGRATTKQAKSLAELTAIAFKELQGEYNLAWKRRITQLRKARAK